MSYTPLFAIFIMPTRKTPIAESNSLWFKTAVTATELQGKILVKLRGSKYFKRTATKIYKAQNVQQLSKVQTNLANVSCCQPLNLWLLKATSCFIDTTYHLFTINYMAIGILTFKNFSVSCFPAECLPVIKTSLLSKSRRSSSVYSVFTAFER